MHVSRATILTMTTLAGQPLAKLLLDGAAHIGGYTHPSLMLKVSLYFGLWRSSQQEAANKT